jgi:leader peptidase (prepilin peptidase) / N-methyltransferase
MPPGVGIGHGQWDYSVDLSTDGDVQLALFTFLAAPAIGSFIGVLAVRIPAGSPVLFSRSKCDHCHTPLAWMDLVPFLSAMVLRGRCRYCGAKIGRFHPLVELAALLPPLIFTPTLSGWPMLGGDVAGWTVIYLLAYGWQRYHLSGCP